jgi:hypothetical protein
MGLPDPTVRGLAPNGRSLRVTPKPGIRGMIERIVPGGETGLELVLPPKKRRMQYTNQSALRRARNRLTGFNRLACSTLKAQGYSVSRPKVATRRKRCS